MKTKYIVAIGAGLAGLAFWSYNKVKTLQAVFDKMHVNLSGISNVGLTWEKITFKVSFEIQNPTNEAFSVTGASLASLKRIEAYRKGVYFGTAVVNLAAIEIPAYSSVPVNNVPFVISLQSLLDNLVTIENFDVAEITIRAVIEVLGTEYTIDS